ncbi:3-oxoacyl-[acyl-carrier-protein] synthase III [Motilibacter rhizosphaerae]|uniref:Beta-ketoacyl-[acyl-carrier-protein] synthase III n=1 Tax=Motilibacter rhizosphaerae TaxID=598652 RepID=A0A4V2F4K8_9ACTN|nr:beta-ketoacyl-ACP synthase III [Motilibacter rhizosphaerae]RZS89669.1 3-oxoacyl-[acyl-carrier-protein] synthase III [Motilibacter rhizosphaerae]
MSTQPEIRVAPVAAGSRLLSLGAYRPQRVVPNAEIVTLIESSDEWIQQRSGIRERRWAGPEETVLAMATAASQQALAGAGLTGADIDLVLLTTMTSFSTTPTAANLLQAAIGSRGGALEMNSACAGFPYALAVADQAVRTGAARHVLVVGVERMTDLLDMADRGTMFLFGDGAGAVVVGAADSPGIGPVAWGSWGEQAEALDAAPLLADVVRGEAEGPTVLRMKGQSVFRWAVTEMPKVGLEALEAAGVKAEQLAAFVPHQANTRIIDAMVKGMGLPEHVAVADDVRWTGNTSAASIPLAMERVLREGRAQPGDLALLVGFGGGLSHAAQVVALPALAS